MEHFSSLLPWDERPTSKMESGMRAARRMEDCLHSSSLLLVEKTFANLVLLI